MDAATKPVKAPWVLEIPGYLPKSLNRLLREHFSARMRETRRAAEHFTLAALLAKVTPPSGKRKVSLVFTAKGGKLPDPDNLLKTVLDGLVKAGVLIDDSADYCVLGEVRVVPGEHPKTMAIVEDIG